MAIGNFDDFSRERLSALADGELESSESAAACSAWSADGRMQGDWHAWHLIGDVLRSDDLACAPEGDRRLLAAIRLRLRDEPVVLAPERPAVRSGFRPSRWAASGAFAAGALLVLGTFAVLRPNESPAPATMARSEAASVGSIGIAPVSPSPIGELAAPPAVVVADNKLIRDAQLDRYLDAHKQFAGSSALGVPSAFLRSATVGSAPR